MPAEADELARIRSAYRRYAMDPDELRRRDAGNAGLRAIADEFHHALARSLSARGRLGPGVSVLDVGCGAGGLLGWFVAHGADPEACHGIDLMPDRVQAARGRVPGAHIVEGQASALPWDDASFDVTVMSMVLSSVLDRSLAASVVREARRVTAPRGVLAIYDTFLPNPRNPDVRAVRRHELEVELTGWDLEIHTISLLPPLSRRLGRATPFAYPLLSRVPGLRARHLVVAERPR